MAVILDSRLTEALLGILRAEGIRAPSTIAGTDGITVGSDGKHLLDWDPALTVEEQAVVDDALARVVSSMSHLTREQYAAVREQMQTLRALRQLGRNAFMALTAAERDRALYDAQTATTIVLLALLRD